LLHNSIQLGHGDLLRPLHRHCHLLLVLSGEEGENLADDGVESFADLGLLVHLDVQPI
jgi:hypothetical protein